jgi:hypothetical protein
MKNLIAYVLCAACTAACGGYEDPEHRGVSQAQVLEHDISVPVDVVADQIGECPEKTLHLTGTVHLLVTYTETGQNFHFAIHFNNQGLIAEGVESGNLYRVGRAQSLIANGSFVNGTYSEHFVATASTTGPEGENRVLQIRFLVTFNANGDVTAFFDDLKVICH